MRSKNKDLARIAKTAHIGHGFDSLAQRKKRLECWLWEAFDQGALLTLSYSASWGRWGKKIVAPLRNNRYHDATLLAITRLGSAPCVPRGPSNPLLASSPRVNRVVRLSSYTLTVPFLP